MSKDHSYKRHIAKTITWRVVGTLDTMILAWFISGSSAVGFQVGSFEVVTKMVLYYFHERIWYRINIKVLGNDSKAVLSRKRHIAKTITWRVLGTLDTMILAWIISGNPITGLKIGGAEVITKMILYYLHERVWYKINFGVEDKRN